MDFYGGSLFSFVFPIFASSLDFLAKDKRRAFCPKRGRFSLLDRPSQCKTIPIYKSRKRRVWQSKPRHYGHYFVHFVFEPALLVFRHEIFAAGQEDDCRIRRVLPYIFKSGVSYAKFDGITFFHIQVFVIFDYLIVGRKHLLDKTVAWLLETCFQDKEAEYDTYEVVKQRGCFHDVGLDSVFD